MSDSQPTTTIQQSHRSVGARLGCLLGRHSGRQLAWLAAGAVAVLLSASPAAASCPESMDGDGTSNPCEITTREHLEAIDDSATTLSLSYQLMNDLNLAGTDWTPIGTNSGPFTGTFDGNDYTISNMTIDLGTTDDVGLFGVADNAAISNLKLVDAAVTGDESVGALVGELRNTSSVSQSSATGNVTGGEVVGGLVGRMSSSSISSSFATGAVVSTRSSAGGLLGGQASGQIVNSYATGAVTTDNQAGGLVGFVDSGFIAISYATGLATATGEGYAAAGGLVGWFNGVSISNSFATGEVRGNDGDGVGGLVGWLETSSEITKSYAIGLIGVSGADDYFGGLVGYNGDTNRTNVTDSFWNTATSGQATSAGGTGKTTTELKTLSTFTDAGWDFVGETTNGESDIWKVTQGNTVSYPYLDGFDYDEPDAEPAVNPIPGLTGPLYAGGSGTETSPYQITNWQQLHNMRFNLGANFVLNNNLDENTGGYTTYVKDGETLASGGTGWTPIGDATNQFAGAFDGDGYTISNMTVSRAGLDYAGLFGYTDGASITDVTLSDIDVLGAGYVGGLVGRANDTTLSGINIVGSTSLVASDVDGDARVGGIVGLLQGASGLDASESYAQVSAPTGNRVGGAAGEVVDSAASLDILEVVIYGDVTGQYRVGGLVGYANQNTNIEGSSIRDATVSGRGSVGGAAGFSANAPVNLDDVVVLNTQVTASDSDQDGSGYSDVGGLIGSAYNTTIVKSVASGVTVEGAGRNIGGAIGYLAAESTLTESYVTGSVAMTGTGTQGGVGGLVGSAIAATNGSTEIIEITDTYTLADVSVPVGGNSSGTRLGVGGLIGYKNNTVQVLRSYAAGIINGQESTSTGGFIGLTTDGINQGFVFYDKTKNPGLADNLYGLTSTQLRASSLFSGQTAWTSAPAGAGTATAGFDYGAMPYLANVTLEDDKDTSLILFAGGWGGLTSTEQAGADGSPYVITNWNELQNINLVVNQGYEFVLANDLIASTAGYTGQVKDGTTLANGGEGWKPIGDATTPFTGNFDGGGYNISNLTMNITSGNAGLFGQVAAGQITNLALTDVDITTSETFSGALAGRVLLGDGQAVVIDSIDVIDPTIDSPTTGTYRYVGGLLGSVEVSSNFSGQVSITNIEIQGLNLTSGGGAVGGLSSRINAGTGSTATITVENVMLIAPQISSASTSDEDGYIGGITGHSDNRGSGQTTLRQLAVRNGTITAVDAGLVGGLVGRLNENSLLDERNVFTGTVSGGYRVGGLAGRLSNNSVVSFAYIQANVIGNNDQSGDADTGLIAGFTSTNAQTVTEVYAVGSVTHTTSSVTDIGVIGEVGASGDVYEDIYYHSTAGAIDFVGGGSTPTITNATELTAQQMQGAEARVNMKGIADTSRWDFGENWIANENDYPIFRWEAEEFDIAVTEPAIFAVGDGSASTPFQIATWTDLQNISLVANEGHHFILMNDLDATSTGYDSEVKDGQVLANGQVGWKPIGRWISSSDFSKAFNGTFDGQNNTISGLRFERDDAANLGLFAAINDATIKNLTLTDAELIATGTTSQVSHVALLAAHAGTFEIDNVSITGEVSVKTSLDDPTNDYELRHIAGVIAEAHVSGTQQAPNAIKNSDFDVTIGVELAADPNPNVRYVGGVFGRADEDFFTIDASTITGQIDIAPSSASTVRGGNIQDVGLIVGLAEDDWSLVNSEITGNINLSQVGNVNRVALGFGETGNRGQVTNANVTGGLNLIDVARAVNVALFAGKSNSDWVLDETALDGVITVESNDYIRDSGLLLGERGAWTVDNTTIEGAMSLTTTSASSGAIQEIGGLAGDPSSGWVVSNTAVDGTLTLSAPNGGVLEVSLGAANSLGAWVLTNVNFTGAIDITAGGRVDDVGLVAAGTRGDWSLNEVGAVGDILITAGNGVAQVGGLIGYRSPSSNTGDYTIETSYTQGEIGIDAQGDVANVGGLLGEIVLSDPNCCDVGTDMAFNITNAYSTMDIGIESTGAVSRVGGLIGNGAEAVFSDQVVELNLTRTYYAGLFDVPADATDAGGLIGRYEDTDLTVTGGYWDGTLSPLTNNKGGEAKTSAEIRSFATFDAGWNQGGVNIVDGWQVPNNPSWGMCPSAQDGLAFLLWQYDQNPCLPDAPTDLVATAGNGEVSIAFTEANGFGVVIGNYRYSLDAGASWVAFNPVVTGSPVVVPGLVNGTSYSIILRAISSVGEGEASEAITATPKTVPAAPSNLTATAGNGEVMIGFDAGNNGGDAITNYEYSLDAGDTWTTFNPAVTTSPLTLAGLANGTEYSIVLRALNGAGAGAASEAVSATPKTVPAAPTNLSATAGNGEAVVAFTAGNNGGDAISNYEYSVDAGNTWTAFDPAVTGSPVTVSGLANGTAHSIVLRAVNGVGTSLASEAVVAQPEIPAPTVSASNVQVTELAGRVLVEWEAPLIDDVVPVTGYRVLIDGEVACTVAATDPLSCAFDDLDPEVAYEISVVVLTDGGIGPQVTEPDVSPLPVIPIPSLSLPSLLLLGLMMLGLGVFGSRRRSIGAC